MNLHTLFDPRSVAIIGADDTPSRVGYALMKNITEQGGRLVYPVTPDKTEVLGYTAFASVRDIPETVDLAVIAVRASIVPSLLEECGEKGIRNVVLISAGFKEMGGEGTLLEATVAETARKYRMTLLGPNCLGVINTHAQWNASFAVEKPLRGNISFVSQSGALGTALIDWANREGVGFSKFVSLGNEAALDELDCMEYLADDPDTNAVLLYLEQVRDGKRFMELAKRITSRKPLVVLRAGETSAAKPLSQVTPVPSPRAIWFFRQHFVKRARLRSIRFVRSKISQNLSLLATPHHCATSSFLQTVAALR